MWNWQGNYTQKHRLKNVYIMYRNYHTAPVTVHFFGKICLKPSE